MIYDGFRILICYVKYSIFRVNLFFLYRYRCSLLNFFCGFIKFLYFFNENFVELFGIFFIIFLLGYIRWNFFLYLYFFVNILFCCVNFKNVVFLIFLVVFVFLLNGLIIIVFLVLDKFVVFILEKSLFLKWLCFIWIYNLFKRNN